MAERETLLRPVIDPGVPEEERRIMAEAPGDLVPACDTPPAAPGWGGRNGRDVFRSLFVGTLTGFLPGVVLARFGWLAIVGALLQIGLVGAWLFDGVGGLLLMGTAIQIVTWVVLLAKSGEPAEKVLGRRHHGRYYLDADFGDVVLKYVRRAQVAITTVMDSDVDSAGLLDEVANDVALPQQEWEIAETCAELTRLKRKLRRLRKSGSVEEILAPQWEALRLSGEAIERRVAALERYADLTRQADEAFQQWKALQELEEVSADARELLARTVRDDLAVAEIDDLADRTPLDHLQLTIEEARRAALQMTEGVAA